MVDGKMPFPLFRSIAIALAHYPLSYLTFLTLPLSCLYLCLSFLDLTMADVQTNLLSYIITKLHSDVARIESLILQVHTG